MFVRTAKQIEGTRKACLVARQILDKAHAGIRPGITTDEVDRIVRSLPTVSHNALWCDLLLGRSCKRRPFELIGSYGLQVHEATIAAGAYPSPLNYGNFPKSVCTSVNEASSPCRPVTNIKEPTMAVAFALGLSHSISAVQVICHGIPDQRPLQDGDIVNVDVSAHYKGFHGDLNETFVVGGVDSDSKRLIRTTLEASLMPLLTGNCGAGK